MSVQSLCIMWALRVRIGTYAQFTVADAFDVKRLPQQMSFEQGAAVSVAFRTAYKALVVRGRIEAGQTVLVHGGSGGVGLAAVQLAKVLGASRIAATAGTQRGRRLLREHGADVVFDHRDRFVERPSAVRWAPYLFLLWTFLTLLCHGIHRLFVILQAPHTWLLCASIPQPTEGLI